MKKEANDKFKSIKKTYEQINELKNDIEEIKERNNLRDLKDGLSFEVLNKILGYGRRKSEETNKVIEIVEILEKLAKSRYIENSHDLYVRGIHSFYLEKLDKAIDFFDKSIQKSREYNREYFFTQAFDAKSNCYFLLKENEKGYETAKEILNRFPDNLGAIHKILFYYKINKEWKEAERFAEKLEKIDYPSYIVEKTIIKIFNKSEVDDKLIKTTEEDDFTNSKGCLKRN